jgi:membrane protein DedA with SNARE-associated domain
MDLAMLADQFLDTYGLIAVFGIMLLKEIGIPVPIPSDLIMLGAAARAAQGRFSFIAVFFAILIPMFLGGLIQFLIARGPARQAVYRLGKYIGLTRERLDRAMETVRKGGVAAVAVGLTTPGVRIAIVPAAGMADLKVATFAPGLLVGSTVFLALHFAIGYAGGAALALINTPAIFVVTLVVVLAVAGFVIWRYVHVRRGATLAETGAAWADAACPACMAITLVRESRGTPGSI